MSLPRSSFSFRTCWSNLSPNKEVYYITCILDIPEIYLHCIFVQAEFFLGWEGPSAVNFEHNWKNVTILRLVCMHQLHLHQPHLQQPHLQQPHLHRKRHNYVAQNGFLFCLHYKDPDLVYRQITRY